MNGPWPPQAPLSLPASHQRLAWGFVAAGVVAASSGLWLAPERTWSNLLVSNFYLLSIGLAGGILLCFHLLSGAGWSAALRRVPEAMMAALPVVSVLVVAVFLGGHQLLAPATRQPAELALPADKARYLGFDFVLARMLIVLGAWSWLAWRLRRCSLAQDRDGSIEHHRSLVRQAALFAVVFAPSFSLAGVDWLMALDPRWFSTIFGVYAFAGLLQLGLAVATLAVLLLRAAGPLREVVSEEHLHDLGKLLFTFSSFWAYIWLSQYLLVWYGDLPEEVTHFVRRTSPEWLFLFLANLVLNWVVPFLALLPRAGKRRPGVLLAVCLVILVGRWLDLYLLVMPETVRTPVFGVLEILIPVGYAGLALLVISRALGRAPIVPLGDPFLNESFHYRG